MFKRKCPSCGNQAISLVSLFLIFHSIFNNILKCRHCSINIEINKKRLLLYKSLSLIIGILYMILFICLIWFTKDLFNSGLFSLLFAILAIVIIEYLIVKKCKLDIKKD